MPIDRFPDTASPPDLTEPPPTDEPVSLPLDQINQDTGNIPREPASTPPADDTETVSEGETTTESTDPEGKFDTDTSESLTHGPIIGIASLSLVCLLLIMFVVHRRRQANQQEKPFAKTTCDNDTSADSDPEAPGSYIESVTRNETSISVFDASGAGEIALKMSSDASSVSQNDFGRGFAIPADRVSMREIEEALDNGNWDEVYKLASHLAEQEDLSTLSSFGRQSTTGRLSNERMERRSVLKEEDHERVKTLDELIDSRDWTGVAVTAALYAGESGYKKQDQSSRSGFFGRVTGQRVSNAAREASSQEVATPVYQNSRSALGARTIEGTSESADDVEAPMENGRNKSSNDLPLFHLKNSMDHAVDAGDWDQVLRISSEVEKNGEFQSRNASPSGSVVATAPSKLCNASSEGESLTAFKTLIEEMDRAMSRGDWALVGFYADKIREMKVSGEDTTPDAMTSQALVPFSGPPAISSARTEDSIMTKKSTLEKLVQAQKWKGVSIMAGLYAMEAKGSLSAELC